MCVEVLNSNNIDDAIWRKKASCLESENLNYQINPIADSWLTLEKKLDPSPFNIS